MNRGTVGCKTHQATTKDGRGSQLMASIVSVRRLIPPAPPTLHFAELPIFLPSWMQIILFMSHASCCVLEGGHVAVKGDKDPGALKWSGKVEHTRHWHRNIVGGRRATYYTAMTRQ